MSGVYEFAAITSYDEVPQNNAFLPAFGPGRRLILAPGEELLGTITARGLALYRGETLRSGWISLMLDSDRCYFQVSGVPVELTLSSRRVILVCEKFEKGGGWRGSPGMMLTANAISKTRAAIRRHGKVLAGQMQLAWLAQIGYHDKHNRRTTNALRLVACDSDGTQVLVDITLDKQTSPRAFTKQIFGATVAERTAAPERLEPQQLSRLQRRVFPLFEPESGKLAFRDIPGALPARADTSEPATPGPYRGGGNGQPGPAMQRRGAIRLLPILLAALATVVAFVALLALASVSNASGGASIASAPTVSLGALESGGGPPSQQYWRLPLVAGDALTLDVEDTPQAHECPDSIDLSLYEPSVTDYQIAQAQPVHTTGYLNSSGKQEFKWTSPFTGAGIFQASGCNNGITSFTFIATVVHPTLLSVHAPALARRGSLITVSALVRSPAGVPQGSCLISGKPAPVTGGQCSGRVRLGHGHRQTIRVAFVPEDGWQASAGHRTIRLVR